MFLEGESGDTHPEEADWSLFNIQAVQGTRDTRLTVEPEVNGRHIQMELDTGAVVTIVSEETWKAHLAELPLQDSNIVLKTYTGEPVQVLGELSVDVCHNGQQAQLPLYVVKGRGPSLFGRNWLQPIRLDWGRLNQVVSGVSQLVQKCEDLFREGLGKMKDFQV